MISLYIMQQCNLCEQYLLLLQKKVNMQEVQKLYKVLTKTKDMTEIEWLKSRQQGIGGSDAGAILGVNNYKTPFDVYIDKTQDIVEPNC